MLNSTRKKKHRPQQKILDRRYLKATVVRRFITAVGGKKESFFFFFFYACKVVVQELPHKCAVDFVTIMRFQNQQWFCRRAGGVSGAVLLRRGAWCSVAGAWCSAADQQLAAKTDHQCLRLSREQLTCYYWTAEEERDRAPQWNYDNCNNSASSTIRA